MNSAVVSFARTSKYILCPWGNGRKREGGQHKRSISRLPCARLLYFGRDAKAVSILRRSTKRFGLKVRRAQLVRIFRIQKIQQSGPLVDRGCTMADGSRGSVDTETRAMSRAVAVSSAFVRSRPFLYQTNRSFEHRGKSSSPLFFMHIRTHKEAY